MAKNQETVSIRIAIERAQKATADLKKFGTAGQAALEKLEYAAKKPTKALGALDKSIAGSTGKLRRMGQVASVIDGPLGGVASRFSGMASLITGAGLAAAGFALTIGGVVWGLKKGLEAFSGFERSMFKTEALLKSTGYASGLTAGQIDTLAISVGRGTLASVEGARKAAGELLTFKSVSGDVFKKTLYLAQDLAASGFGTLETNTIQLGKALEDPILGLTALRRVGVSFTDQQRDMIKTMVEVGNVAGAQAKILKILENQVGGAGLAEAKGLAGSFDTLSENVGLFFEAVGSAEGTAVQRFFADLAKNVESTTYNLFPPLIEEARRLKIEIAALEDQARKAPSMDELVGVLGAADIASEGLMEKALQRRLRLREIELSLGEKHRERENAVRMSDFAQTNRTAEAQSALKEKAAKKWAKVLFTVERQSKKLRTAEAKKSASDLVAAERKAASERASARKSGLAKLSGMEERAAQATLSKLDFLKRAKLTDENAIDSLRKKGLISETELLKASSSVNAFYGKKILDERAKIAEETFGGQASKQVASYFEEINNGGKRSGAFLVTAFKSVEDSLAQFFMGSKVTFRDFMTSIKAGLARLAAQDVISGIGSALGIGSSSAPGGGSIIGSFISGAGSFISSLFAEGGQVSGPGTGTSDSIVARLSDGEFIVNAAATQRHLPLLHAINDNNRYATGGLVANDTLPRFSLGGPAGGGAGFGHGAPGLDGSAGQRGFSQGRADRENAAGHGFTGGADGRGGSGSGAGSAAAVDTRGFWDRIADFFSGPTSISPAGAFETPAMASIKGYVSETGFLGSSAAGAGLGILGALLGGIPGLAFSALGNLTRAAQTGGLAQGTGIGGAAYDLFTGRRTMAGIVGNLTGKFGGGTALASSGFGRSGGDAVFGVNDNSASRADGFRTDAAGLLGDFGAQLANNYRGVESTGLSVMRGLKHGGRFTAGENFVVGEDGPEILRQDRPGTITPMAQAVGGNDNRELVDLVAQLLEETRQTRRETARAMDQMASFASSHATSAAVRKTTSGLSSAA